MSWFYILFVIYSQCKHIHIKTIYGLSLSCKITLLLQDTIKAPQCTVFSKIEVFFHFVILSFLISREMCEQSQNSFIAVVWDRFILTLDFIYYSDLLPQSFYISKAKYQIFYIYYKIHYQCNCQNVLYFTILLPTIKTCIVIRW